MREETIYDLPGGRLGGLSSCLALVMQGVTLVERELDEMVSSLSLLRRRCARG